MKKITVKEVLTTAMGKQTTTGNRASRVVWDNLEEWVRKKVQEFIQSLLEEEIAELLGRCPIGLDQFPIDVLVLLSRPASPQVHARIISCCHPEKVYTTRRFHQGPGIDNPVSTPKSCPLTPGKN